MPAGTDSSLTPPEVGALIAFDFGVYRIVDVRDRSVDFPDQTYSKCLELERIDKPMRRHRHVGFQTWWAVHVYRDEHYPVCAKCHEPTPCREKMIGREVQAAARLFSEYDTPGMCPACHKPISTRQKTITFKDNIVVPLGGPVVFHAKCRHAAAQYEAKWAALDPENRRTTLSCPGDVIVHGDNTYECSERVECRGPATEHQSVSMCSCPPCYGRNWALNLTAKHTQRPTEMA
jgi:hypothetical protein